MLWEKGVGEFVEAARIMRQSNKHPSARFVLVGDPDDDNRGSIPRETLEAWVSEGVIEWWGFRPDVENALAQATISCLPSYREGLPKSLLESLAMGLPCIATDVPGCREAVKDGINGILVPVRDASGLAVAIESLLQAPDQMERFGVAARQMAVHEFDKKLVNQQTIDLYDDVLN